MTSIEIADFPRGGAQILTPLETRKIKDSAKKDVLFDTTSVEPEKKKKKKNPKNAANKEKDNLPSVKNSVVSHFAFKYLVKDMLVLGYIKEIHKNDIVIGLSNGLSGFVNITDLKSSLSQNNEDEDEEASDDEENDKIGCAAELFTVGQLVPVTVKDLFPFKTGYQKISLSVFPEDVNSALTTSCMMNKMIIWGRITSIEDHGYAVSIGKDKISGFLSKTEDLLKIGMLRWFCVEKVSKKIINLSVDHQVISKAYLDNSKVHFNALLPGQMLKMNVTDRSEDGLSGKVCGGFDAIVESLHLMSSDKSDEDKVTGRIIHVNPKTKQIGLSLAPEIVDFQENIISAEHRIGDIIEDCEVVKSENKYGLVMKMKDANIGVVHVSRISDERIEKLSKRHKVGTKHTCRVLGFSALDSSYTLTMKPSDMEKTFLRYEDLKGGMKIAGEVISLEDFGCLIKITNQIRGLCPKLHLADINLTHPEKKFVEGKKLKFRVLYVKPESRKLILTHKKTLMKSKIPPILSLDDIKVGQVVQGFVSRMKHFGLFVSFYNEIKGLLPKSELNIPKTSKLEESYYVGQVVQCTVIVFNKEENKFILSMKDQSEQLLNEALKRGEVVAAQYKGISDKKSLKMSSKGNECYLPENHYSDFNTINKDWKVVTDSLKVDFSMKDLIVVGINKRSREMVLSQKQVLIQSKCDVNKFEDLKVGMVCGGIVSHIMSYGVFVEVAPNVSGLIPISQLSDEFVKSPEDTYFIGQSLIVKVTEIDTEKHRFLISSKPSIIKVENNDMLNATFSGCAAVREYLVQRKRLHQDAMRCQDKILQMLPTLIGEIIITKVIKVETDGITISYCVDSQDIEGFIPSSLRYGSDFEIGKECQCYVFSIDMKSKQFLATSNEEAISMVIKQTEEQKEMKFSEDKKINAVVMHIDENVVTLLLPDYGYTIAFMPYAKHINEQGCTNKHLKVGQSVFVKFDSNDKELGVVVRSIDDIDVSGVKVGINLTAVVKGIKPTQLSVTLLNGKMHGRVHMSNIADDFVEGKSLLAEFQPLQLIEVKVIGFKDMKTHTYLPITQNLKKELAELSLKPSVLESENVTDQENEDPRKGETVSCFVTSVTKRFIWVSVSPSVKGKISILHFSNDAKELKRLSSSVKPGCAYKAIVVGRDEEHNCTELSRIGDPVSLVVKGGIMIGHISRIMDNGLLVELPNYKAGIVNITELHDVYKNDPLNEFSVNQYVKCKILNVGKGDKIDLSLRESRLSSVTAVEDNDRLINSYDDIKDGDILRGFVKSCSKVGVFVSLSANITGRVQIKNLSQFFVKNYIKLFPVGRLVKAKVLSIDPANNHIDLSLRGKDVGGPDLVPPPKRKLAGDENEDDEVETKKRKVIEEESESESDDDSDSGIDDAQDDNEDTAEENNDNKPSLQLSTAFDWSADAPNKTEADASRESDDTSNDEGDTKNAQKKSKRQKRAAKKAEEEYLHKTELALLDTKTQLESAEDYDRLILGSPDSSMVWIQYMAFHLHSAEVEKARAVGEKAIKSISYREEQEKFNVWVALLNLESMYGTTESLDKCFQNMLRVNDPKKVYAKMVDVYIKNEKQEEAEKMYQVMIRRFRTSAKVWTGYGQFMMKTGQLDGARKLLQRSLKSLPQRKHIETIVKFAVMEYKMGEANRGSTIFESILKNYPKRTDLWSIYIDMNIKAGAVEQVRNIFERATALVMHAKKMKFLFKRYLKFEEQYGDNTTVEYVRKKALEYVENKMVEDE